MHCSPVLQIVCEMVVESAAVAAAADCLLAERLDGPQLALGQLEAAQLPGLLFDPAILCPPEFGSLFQEVPQLCFLDAFLVFQAD